MILNEEVDLSSVEAIISSMKKGMIPGVSFKTLNPSEEDIKKILNLSSNYPQQFRKEIILLVLKRLNNNIENLRKTNFDAVYAFVSNRKKQLAKTTLKKDFEDFESSEPNLEKDIEFENKVNETFSDLIKMKDSSEIKKIYSKDDWEIFNPLTFAANKELAQMNGRKATWCTAARADFYKRYSADGKVPIYIIKNKTLDKMYQLDFGNTSDEYSSPSFQDEKNVDMTTERVLKEIPEEVLSAIHNKNLNLYQIISGKGEGKKEVVRKTWTVTELTRQQEKELNKEYNRGLVSGATLSPTFETASKAMEINHNQSFLMQGKGRKIFTYAYANHPRKFIELLKDGKTNVLSREDIKVLDIPLAIKKRLLENNIELKEKPLSKDLPEEDGFKYSLLFNRSAIIQKLEASGKKYLMKNRPRVFHSKKVLYYYETNPVKQKYFTSIKEGFYDLLKRENYDADFYLRETPPKVKAYIQKNFPDETESDLETKIYRTAKERLIHSTPTKVKIDGVSYYHLRNEAAAVEFVKQHPQMKIKENKIRDYITMDLKEVPIDWYEKHGKEHNYFSLIGATTRQDLKKSYREKKQQRAQETFNKIKEKIQ